MKELKENEVVTLDQSVDALDMRLRQVYSSGEFAMVNGRVGLRVTECFGDEQIKLNLSVLMGVRSMIGQSPFTANSD